MKVSAGWISSDLITGPIVVSGSCRSIVPNFASSDLTTSPSLPLVGSALPVNPAAADAPGPGAPAAPAAGGEPEADAPAEGEADAPTEPDGAAEVEAAGEGDGDAAG